MAIAPQSNSLVTLYLAYSIPFGIGTSFIFNAGLVIVSNYFTRRRSLALGFVSAGQGMGVLVQGPLLQTLIDNYGWKTTYRIMAGLVFGICLLGITYDPNVKCDKGVEDADQLESSDKHFPHQRGQKKKSMFLDVSVWKIPAFVAITLSSAIAQFGHFVPQIHLVSSIAQMNTEFAKLLFKWLPCNSTPTGSTARRVLFVATSRLEWSRWKSSSNLQVRTTLYCMVNHD